MSQTQPTLPPILKGCWEDMLHRRRNQPGEAGRQWQQVAMHELPEDGNVDDWNRCSPMPTWASARPSAWALS